jgi:hypothetical protein
MRIRHLSVLSLAVVSLCGCVAEGLLKNGEFIKAMQKEG